MVNLVKVTLAAGVPTDSGDVSTIDALMALVGDNTASPVANTVQDRLKAIASYVDGIETLLGTTNTNTGNTNTLLTSIAGYVDQLESYTDGLETLITGTNTKLDTLVSGLGSPGTQTKSVSTSITPASDMDAMRMSQDTSILLNGNVSLTPKFAKIAISATGDIVALVTGKKIRVLAAKIVANAAVNAKWTSGTGPTDITGLSYLAAAGDGEVLPFNPLGWFETASGEKLTLALSASVAVGGHITYVEV